MNRSIGGDRRSADRRRRPTAGDATATADRRRGERRKWFRLYYPRTAMPKVLNANFHIINISREAIGFICQDSCEQCTQPITLKSVLDLKVEFHDGETLDVKVKILRCQRDLSWDEKYYAGIIEGAISAERIGEEQAYLLRHYPDFCRFSRASSVAHMETPLYYEDHDIQAASQGTT
jgi:hypothetical protein